MANNNQPLVAMRVVGWALVIALLIIPTMLSIFIAFEVKNTSELRDTGGPQIVCLDSDNCAIEVRGTWYRIAGTIQMDQIIPQEYRFDQVPDQPDHEQVGLTPLHTLQD